MKPNEYVHTPYDGRISEDLRTQRDVFVNGKKIDGVMYADTKRGIVRIVRRPIKTDKYHKRVLTRTIRGHVEVVFK